VLFRSHPSNKPTTAANKAAPRAAAARPGSERARDEQRSDAGPQYAGSGWQEADQPGEAQGEHDRIENTRGARNDDDAPPRAESGGEHARRGEKPRKPKSEAK